MLSFYKQQMVFIQIVSKKAKINKKKQQYYFGYYFLANLSKGKKINQQMDFQEQAKAKDLMGNSNIE